MKISLTSDYRVLAVLILACLSSSLHAQTADDEITTAADLGPSGMYLAVLHPVSTVAIDREEADVFSIYIDKGTGKAFFLSLLSQSGMYVVTPKDHVIVKTQGQKTLTLESSTKSSGALRDYAFCPDSDTPVETFRATHPVNEGEYIYLLTNMESNGGFGLTHFTGDIMRKGYFFIVSTIEPQTTAISSTRSKDVIPLSTDNAIYDLGGRKVTSPCVGQIYIQYGRKFLATSNNIAKHLNSKLQTAHTRAVIDLEDGDQIPFLPGEAGNDDGFVTMAKTPETTLVRGDANGDGIVNGKDVEAITNYIIENPNETFVMEAADVNGDDVINVADIVGTVKIVMDGTE